MMLAHAVALSLALLAHALPTPEANNAVLSVPLRRATGTKANRTSTWVHNQGANLRNKYHVPSSIGRRSAQGSTPLVNVNADTSYYGTVLVGTPPTPFNLILDTGSADLWVAGQTCTNCADVPQFNPRLSSSFVSTDTPFSIQYGSGAAAGVMGVDVVQMAGFEIPNQPFAIANSVTQGLLNNDISGILGLGFGTIASSGTPPFVQTLAQQGVLQQPLFSFFLTRFLDVLQTGDNIAQAGGEVMLGGTNTSLYTGEIEFVDIPAGREGFWGIEMSTMMVNGVEVVIPTRSSFSAIDTGTTLIAGPAALVAEIYAQVPGAEPGQGDLQDFWLFPCSSDFSVQLSFGPRGQHSLWSIDPRDLILMRTQGGVCVGSIFSIDIGHSNNPNAPAWIVGDTFLKNVYNVYRFDPPAVGFALLSPLAESLSGVRDAPLPDPSVDVSPVTATAATEVSNAISKGDPDAGGGASHAAASVLATIFAALFVGVLVL